MGPKALGAHSGVCAGCDKPNTSAEDHVVVPEVLVGCPGEHCGALVTDDGCHGVEATVACRPSASTHEALQVFAPSCDPDRLEAGGAHGRFIAKKAGPLLAEVKGVGGSRCRG